jgi:hypothetical protein
MLQSTPDFSGVWKMNFERSALKGPAPKQIVMRIEHREPKLLQEIVVMSEIGQEQRVTFNFDTTGIEASNSVGGAIGRTRAQWVGRELAIESWLKIPGRELHFKDYWSLSSDGQILTMAHRGDDLDGQITVLEKSTHTLQ